MNWLKKMLYTYGKWVSYPQAIVQPAIAEIADPTEYTPEEIGEAKETYAMRVLSYLNVKIEIVPRCSTADAIAKWDILIWIKGKAFPLQIKSSQAGRLKYEGQKPQINHQPIPHCPCLILERELNRSFLGFEVLKDIIKTLRENRINIRLSKEAENALKTYQSFKKAKISKIPKAAAANCLPGKTAQILTHLGLGCFQGETFHLF